MNAFIIILTIICFSSLAANIYVYIKFEKPLGPPGFRGKRGPIGDKGPNGQIGTTGLIGPKGIIGAKGLNRGSIGDTGEKGFKGRRGNRGQKGINGLIGDPGEPGPIGLTGDKGEKGMPGNLGYEGPPVTKKGFQYIGLPYSCEWSENLKCPTDKAMFDVSGTLEGDKVIVEKAYCCNIDIVDKGTMVSELTFPQFNDDVSDYIEYLRIKNT